MSVAGQITEQAEQVHDTSQGVVFDQAHEMNMVMTDAQQMASMMPLPSFPGVDPSFAAALVRSCQAQTASTAMMIAGTKRFLVKVCADLML
jgi:hypothetical protein